MLDMGRSNSTIGIYLRQLRAIINQAIDAGVLSQDKYPFRKYEIPSGRNIKKALSESQISQLLNHTPENPDQQKALDFWILSYLCNGMNFADIVALKPGNMAGNYLHFIREKTKKTKKKDLRPIKVGLNPRAKEIIKKWSHTDPANPYLFPILEEGLTPLTIKYRCQRFTKWVNKHMEEIRKDLKIDQKIGTYAARHSFSTVLKRKGVSTEFIKEALGHSSVVVTENYLDSFTDDVKLEYANMLTNI
jgi:integrase/recombinase XerD